MHSLTNRCAIFVLSSLRRMFICRRRLLVRILKRIRHIRCTLFHTMIHDEHRKSEMVEHIIYTQDTLRRISCKSQQSISSTAALHFSALEARQIYTFDDFSESETNREKSQRSTKNTVKRNRDLFRMLEPKARLISEAKQTHLRSPESIFSRLTRIRIS